MGWTVERTSSGPEKCGSILNRRALERINWNRVEAKGIAAAKNEVFFPSFINEKIFKQPDKDKELQRGWKYQEQAWRKVKGIRREMGDKASAKAKSKAWNNKKKAIKLAQGLKGQTRRSL